MKKSVMKKIFFLCLKMMLSFGSEGCSSSEKDMDNRLFSLPEYEPSKETIQNVLNERQAIRDILKRMPKCKSYDVLDEIIFYLLKDIDDNEDFEVDSDLKGLSENIFRDIMKDVLTCHPSDKNKRIWEKVIHHGSYRFLGHVLNKVRLRVDDPNVRRDLHEKLNIGENTDDNYLILERKKVLLNLSTCTSIEEIQYVFNDLINDTTEKRPFECELVDIKTSSKDLDWYDAEPNYRTMIIEFDSDCNLIKSYSEGRYKHRIAGRYKLDPMGGYQQCQTSVKMSRGLSEILHQTSGAHRFIPEKGIDRETKLLLNKTLSDMDSIYSHGGPILSFIAENTPQATFYLAEVPSYYNFDVCHADLDDIKIFMDKNIDYLKNLIVSEEIRFINFSGGVAKKSIYEPFFHEKCGDVSNADQIIDEILNQHARWIYEISSIPNVFFAQASFTFNFDEDKSSLSSYESYCNTNYAPNRFRVNFFDQANSSIPLEGSSFEKEKIDINNFNHIPHKCVDVYINTGLHIEGADEIGRQKPGPRPIEIGSGLFSVSPLNIPSTSYLNPVALSYFMYLYGDNLSLSPAELIHKVTQGGNIPLHDPIKNEQFESFRLKKAWYWDTDPTL